LTSVIVIGAGNGGLTAATVLAKQGYSVKLLEAHSYSGGCAGTFKRKGYLFDAGATLTGGFNNGEVMHNLLNKIGLKEWFAKFDENAMTVHLPNKIMIPRYGDDRRWDIRAENFGDESLNFWKWQENTADLMWSIANKSPPFPPQNLKDYSKLSKILLSFFSEHFPSSINPSLLKDAFTTLSNKLSNQNEPLRMFIDGQLLISTQTLSRYANSLFSASALDLPRRGIVHFKGGIGTLAKQLETSFKSNGGTIHFKEKVISILKNKNGYTVITNKNHSYHSNVIIANLNPWDLKSIIPKNQLTPKLKRLPPLPKKSWGAFTTYIGIKNEHLPDNISLHNQILSNKKFTEGNSIFISISPSWDTTRAPENQRTITISSHTNLNKWWTLLKNDKEKYLQLKNTYENKLIGLAKTIIPKINNAELIESGTPVTFNHFTNRIQGWVGGFRQENLFKTFPSRIDANLFMVGDSIFPGQSTAAVSLGGIRVANSIMEQF